MEQCLERLVEVKPAKKFLGSKFGSNSPKSGTDLGFLPFSQVWYISFPFTCIDDSLEQSLINSRSKTHKKIGGPNFGPKLGFLSFFQVWFISFPGSCIG